MESKPSPVFVCVHRTVLMICLGQMHIDTLVPFASVLLKKLGTPNTSAQALSNSQLVWSSV